MPWRLVADHARSGRLASSFGFIPAQSGFALLAAPGVSSRALDQFRRRLLAESARTQPSL